MALPKIDTPTYETVLPVSKIDLRFRPFLVKEQKVLLMAMESNEKSEIENNIHQILQNCVLNDVDVGKLPIIDVEYFFLQLRARSVGEIVESKYKCENVVDEKPCGNLMNSSLNILDLKVKFPEESHDDIKITDKIGMKLKYPTFELTKKLQKTDNVTTTAFELLIECIEYIYDEDKIYHASETSREELMEFLESLTKGQFENVEKFVSNLPKIDKKIDIKCSKCGFEHNLTVEGLESFFG